MAALGGEENERNLPNSLSLGVAYPLKEGRESELP